MGDIIRYWSGIWEAFKSEYYYFIRINVTIKVEEVVSLNNGNLAQKIILRKEEITMENDGRKKRSFLILWYYKQIFENF